MIAVYILASQNRRLFVGVTSDLVRRIQQHQLGRGSAFAIRYRMNRLVYYEAHGSVVAAIRRERQLKSWDRTRMVGLIELENATWQDLSARWSGGLSVEPGSEQLGLGHR
jgi:putative endonuclease